MQDRFHSVWALMPWLEVWMKKIVEKMVGCLSHQNTIFPNWREKIAQTVFPYWRENTIFPNWREKIAQTVFPYWREKIVQIVLDILSVYLCSWDC